MIPDDPLNTQSRGEPNLERVKNTVEVHNHMVQLIILTTLDIVDNEKNNLIWLSSISMFHIDKFHTILNNVFCG